jgi:general stress protein 26
MIITASANFVCVWLIKLIEEKSRKDKLWKVEATVLRSWTKKLHADLVENEIPHNYLENVGKYTLFNLYCATQKESAKAKEILDKYEAKYFVGESKAL